MTFTPANAARNLPRNKGKRGDTIVYRDPFTMLVSEMMVEDVAAAADHVGVVYFGSGNRVIHSRFVREVK